MGKLTDSLARSNSDFVYDRRSHGQFFQYKQPFCPYYNLLHKTETSLYTPYTFLTFFLNPLALKRVSYIILFLKIENHFGWRDANGGVTTFLSVP
jgi:hypothetical protein